jgi:RND family efflux transporter MFP subunit
MKNTMKKIGVLLIALIVLASCGSESKDDRLTKLENLKQQREELTAEINALEADLIAEGIIVKDKSISVKIQEVDTVEFNSYLEIQGTVDGEENVIATGKTMGVANGVYVKEGQQVYAGQVLASMDASVLQQSLAELQNQYDFLVDIYNRQKSLWEQNIGSEMQYLQAKNNMESMDKRIATVKQQIAMNYITSPINGRVEEVNLKVGSSVSPGVPAFRVVNFSKVKVEAEVSEAYTDNIKVGNTVLIEFPDLSLETEAKLDFVGKYINPNNRSFQVECKLTPEKGMEFRANMMAVMKINNYSNPKAIVIPLNVIQSSSKGDYVFVVVSKDKKQFVETRYVEKGEIYKGNVEVVDGLKEGDQVVTQGFNNLKDGSQIKIIE